MNTRPVGQRSRPSKEPTAPSSYKNSTVNVPASRDDHRAFAAAVARTLGQPEVSAAAVIEAWQKDTHDINAVVTELSRQVEAVNGGDMKRAEGMLIAQAHALDTMFVNLARRATTQEYLKQWEAYMRMAMKAQAQCRMTLETLAAIKNPPVVFARQANINNGGQQQVNNGAPSGAAAPVGGASSLAPPAIEASSYPAQPALQPLIGARVATEHPPELPDSAQRRGGGGAGRHPLSQVIRHPVPD